MSLADAPYEVLALSRVRRATGKRLRASLAEKPPVTLHRTVSAQPLFARLERLRAGIRDGVKHTLTSVLAIPLARALARSPVMNCCTEEGELRRYTEVHLAVAVATDDGLVPVVLRPADLADEDAAAHALARLSHLARRQGLKPTDLVPSTFTLTNLGAYGIEYFTPILNPPHVGILGVGCSSARGLPLSLTFDHAALDGIDGARFLQALADELAAG